MGKHLRVLKRRTAVGNTCMWGTLYIDPIGASYGGWLCDSWTDRGASAADMLQPEMHWLAKEDGKFHRVRMGTGGVEVFGVDTEIEPRREAFMRSTLAEWEQEYLDAEAERLSEKNPY
jgi:hypothetical protein